MLALNFDVYDKKINTYCANTPRSHDCYWQARPGGFYLSKDNQNWKKFNTWTCFPGIAKCGILPESLSP